jgi:hypothetical protein
MISLLLIDHFHLEYFQQNQEIMNNQYHEMSKFINLIRKQKKKKILY